MKYLVRVQIGILISCHLSSVHFQNKGVHILKRHYVAFEKKSELS